MYILMINKAIKCSLFFVIYFLGLFSKRIENIFFVFLSSYRNTRESLGELEKAVETRKMFSIPWVSRKHRPCKQKSGKHRRVTNTLKNNSLCSGACYGH